MLRTEDTIQHTHKAECLVVMGDWNAKAGNDSNFACPNIKGRFINESTNERE